MSNPTPNSEAAICNLIYRYAELIDQGAFEQVAVELFSHAQLLVAPDGSRVDGAKAGELFGRTTIRYADGTPRTKHVVTNPIIEVDESRGAATCRSYYTVFQQTDSLPFQPILSGRYRDRFERVDNGWRFAERDYTLIDFVGDTSQHVTFDMKGLKATMTDRP